MGKTDRNWDDLVRIADALYQRDSKALSAIRADQARMTKLRRSLDEMNDSALKAFVGPHPAHWHDGEVLWQKWIGQNKRQLGIEEARLRALAEIQMPALRKSFGRAQVLKNLKESHAKLPTSSG